jgi:hypothetical protein
MKKTLSYTSLLSIFIFCFLLSCKKDQETWGDFSVTQDGLLITNSPTARESFESDELFHIDVAFLDKNGFINKTIGLLYLPKKEGIYHNLKRRSSSSNLPINQCVPFLGDVFENDLSSATYYIGEGDTTSFIEIQCIKRRKVEGIFDIILVKDSLSRIEFPDAKDTIRLTNGYFNCKIRDAN